MHRLFRSKSVSRIRLGVEDLEGRTQPAVLDLTGIFGATTGLLGSTAGLFAPATTAPATTSAAATSQTASSLVVIGLPAGSVIVTPAVTYTPAEFLFITPSLPTASTPVSQGTTGAGTTHVGGGTTSTAPEAAAPVAPANPVTAGSPTTSGTTTSTSPTNSSVTVVLVDLVTSGLIARAAAAPVSQLVVFGPPQAGAAATGSDPGTTPVVPTNPFLAPGSSTFQGAGPVVVPTLPAVVYWGVSPDTLPAAPEPREVQPGGGAAPRNESAPAEIAPPPRSVGQVDSVSGVAGLQVVATASSETESAPVVPAPAAETSSVWGWVGAVTAVVATGYWVAYRYWRRKSLTVRRAVMRFLPDSFALNGTSSGRS